MRFVGLDLAWSPRNPSGGVVLGWEGERARPLAWQEALGPDEEITAFIRDGLAAEPGLIAIDAPLLVPNETGTRPCDLALSQAYRQKEAGALPANRRRLGPRPRGEELVHRLSDLGFTLSPRVPPRQPVRQVIEVYPHPAAVELFGLKKTLKYKARKGRSLETRRRELSRYRQLLASLRAHKPPLGADKLLRRIEVAALRGGALKRAEDLLDALFCAYIALYIWWHGPDGYRVFGDETNGFILVPIRVPGSSPPRKTR